MRTHICERLRICSHRIFLVAPGVGRVQGTECANRGAASVLLSDRIANGEAFNGEFVCRVPARSVIRAENRARRARVLAAQPAA